MEDKFYSKGGPVLLSIGGEGKANPIWMEDGAWVQYAHYHKAMMFMVEHRYYGDTHPTRSEIYVYSYDLFLNHNFSQWIQHSKFSYDVYG